MSHYFVPRYVSGVEQSLWSAVPEAEERGGMHGSGSLKIQRHCKRRTQRALSLANGDESCVAEKTGAEQRSV